MSEPRFAFNCPACKTDVSAYMNNYIEKIESRIAQLSECLDEAKEALEIIMATKTDSGYIWEEDFKRVEHALESISKARKEVSTGKER